MTWREGFEEWKQVQSAIDRPRDEARLLTYHERVAFLAGAKWMVADLIEKRVWESRDIVYELQKRLEEE